MIDVKNHSVLVPIGEYNELMKTQSMAGITEIDLNQPSNNAFRSAVVEQYKKQSNGVAPSPAEMAKLKLYFKIV